MSDTPETQGTDGAQDTHQAPTTPDTDAAQSAPAEPAPAEPTPAEPVPAEPADVAPPLATLIAAIRAAVAPGASPAARAAGATACRSVLTVLEAKPGEPLAPAPAPSMSPTSPPSSIASMLSQPGFLTKLAAMPREQLLDLIKQVTGAMPARPHTPATAAPRFHLIQIPQTRRSGGT